MPSSPPTADSESHVKKKTPRAVTAKRIQQNREAQRVYRDRKKVKASNLDAKLRDLEERNARLDAENMMLKLGAAGAPDSALTDLRSNLVRLKSENEALKQVIVDLELKLALAEASSRDMHRTSATLVSQSNPSIMNSQCTNGAVAREYFEKDSRDRTQPITSTSTKSNVSKRGIHDHLFVSTRDNPISHGNEKGNNSSIDVVDSMRTDEEGWFDILAVNNGHFQSAEDLFGPLAGVEEAILALKKIPSLQNASTSVENMVNAAIAQSRCTKVVKAQQSIVATGCHYYNILDQCSLEDCISVFEVMDAWAYKNVFHHIQAHHIATFMMDLNSVAEVEQLDPHPDPAICKFRAACLSIPPLQEAVVLINQISIIDHKDPDAVKKFFKQFTLGTNLINLCIEIQDRHKVQIALEIFRRDTEGYMEELMEQVAQQLDKINFKDHGTDY